MAKKRRLISKRRRTAADVVEQLGGIAAVAELTGRNVTCVHNWIRYDQFSARVYVVMTRALARRGKRAPVSLWGQDQIAA